MLFKLKQGEDIKELNPGINAIPEFAVITSQQMTAVALIADYDSPLRKLTPRAKRERAALLAGYPMESDGKRLDKNGRNIVLGKVESIEKAIAAYEKLEPDEDKESIRGYDNMIQKINDLMNSEKPDDLDQAVKLSKQLPEIKEARKAIQEKINSRDYKPEIETFTSSDLDDVEEGDEELSTIDRVMQKQKNNAAN